MSAPPTDPQERLTEFLLQDASERGRFQQEFSIAGFKALILINGGAVIALLTYAGNAHPVAAAQFGWAFGGYIAGLLLAVLAYLTAYMGQALLMWHSSCVAMARMGVREANEGLERRLNKWAHISIGVGALLCLLSLAGFVSGSVSAMRALM